jgi:hypothetical protein
MSIWWWLFDGFLVAIGYLLCWISKDRVKMIYTSVDSEVEYLKGRIHDLTGK